MVFSKQRVCPREAGVGGCAYHDFIIGEFVPELLDYGCCRVDLADADGVQPDAPLLGVFAGDSAEALRPAFAVAIVPDKPVQRNGSNGYGSQQIQKVDYDSHRLSMQINTAAMVLGRHNRVKPNAWRDALGCAEAAPAETKPCPQCRDVNDGDAKFCDNRGHNFA